MFTTLWFTSSEGSRPFVAAGTFTSSSISLRAKFHVKMKKHNKTRSTSTIGAI